MDLLLKILAVFALNFILPVLSQYSQCLNPQSLRGHCIPLQQCNYILNIARFNQQNPEAQSFLSRSQCGFDGYNTYVCCPQTTQLKPDTQRVNQNQNQNLQLNRNIVHEKSGNSLLPKPPACGSDAEDRIFGGTKTSIYEFPWFALLKYSKPGSSSPVFSCSGSLINERYTITAAHCVDQKILQRTRLIGVRLGEWNVQTNPDCDDGFVNEKLCNDPFIDVGIEEVITHEKYLPQSFNQHNDIALIRLSYKVTFNSFVKPICLEADSSQVGQSVTVAGFGKTETSLSSNVKLKVSLNIVDNEKCNQVFRVEGRRLHDLQLCAGGQRNIDSCRGDSGGPVMKLVVKGGSSYWVLVGIVSYGSNPCGQENKPAVYTKVDGYINWIENVIRV